MEKMAEQTLYAMGFPQCSDFDKHSDEITFADQVSGRDILGYNERKPYRRTLIGEIQKTVSLSPHQPSPKV